MDGDRPSSGSGDPQRRLHVLAMQLAPSGSGAPPSGPVPLARQPCAASTSGAAGSSHGDRWQHQAPYASATGQPNSYARVHGEVPRAPATWRSVPVVNREELTDVKYDKAVGEGIAKVGALTAPNPGHRCAGSCAVAREGRRAVGQASGTVAVCDVPEQERGLVGLLGRVLCGGC